MMEHSRTSIGTGWIYYKATTFIVIFIIIIIIIVAVAVAAAVVFKRNFSIAVAKDWIGIYVA